MRSRQHRLLLSFYVGTSGAISLILLRLSQKGDTTDIAVAWLTVSLLTLAEVCVAMRMLLAMPMTPRANWVFRMAALDPVAEYARGVQRSFLWLAVTPVLVCFGVVFFAVWPWRTAAVHWTELALIGVIMAEMCAYGFHKIPFTCTYQPGRANIQFAFWGLMGALPLTRLAMKYEWTHLRTPQWTAAILAVLSVLALAARWTTGRAAVGAETLQFEGFEEPEVMSLKLPQESGLLR